MAKVYISSVVNAPAAKVWARVRDFNGLPGWHPAIGESRIENGEPADKVGCIRDFRLATATASASSCWACRTTTCSAPTRSWNRPWEWRTTSPRCRLTPVTDGQRTFLEWTAEFDCAPEREAELVSNIGTGVFQGGFDALKRQFGG